VRFDQHKPNSLFEAYASLKDSNFQQINEAKGGIPSNAQLSAKQKWKDASELGKPGRYPYVNRMRGQLTNAVGEYRPELKVAVRIEMFPDEHEKRFKDKKKEAIVDKEVEKRMKTMFLGYSSSLEDMSVQWNWDSGKKMFVKDPESVEAHQNEMDATDQSIDAEAKAYENGTMPIMRKYFESMRQLALKDMWVPVDGNDQLAYEHAYLWADEQTVEEYPEWSTINHRQRNTARKNLASTERRWPGTSGKYDDHYEKVDGKWVGKMWKV
jgi:hypothetical protein